MADNSVAKLALLVALSLSSATAQQVIDSYLPLDLLGLSNACFEAVNTTLPSCPSWLQPHATSA
jgi:hypothetical protein